MDAEEPPKAEPVEDPIMFALRHIDYVFTPSSPVMMADSLQGRAGEIQKIIDCIKELGQHAIIYGDRGVGKTSLANIVPTFFSTVVPVIKVTCNRSDTFKQVWLKALDELPQVVSKPSIGFNSEVVKKIINMSAYIPQKDIVTTTEISRILKNLPSDKYTLFVFDEFDTIINEATKQSFADLIKELSDAGSGIKIIIVGIGGNIIELIGHHRSIERCVRQIPLKRLDDDAVSKIAQIGYDKIGMTYDSGVIDNIKKYSTGLGHYAHLLSKYIGKYTLSQKRLRIEVDDFFHGVIIAIENASETIKEEYRIAILSDNNKFRDVLHACANAVVDEHGAFGNTEIIEAYRQITGDLTATQPSLAYAIGKLLGTERGEVLIKLPGKYPRYKFRNQLLETFVYLQEYKRANKT